MRYLSLFSVVVLLAPSPMSAQEQDVAPGRLGFALGLARSESAEGLTGRVMYAPLGLGRPLTFQLEAGFRWTPSHRFWAGSPLINPNGLEGKARGADIAVGVTAVLSPSPKSRVAPYLIGGVLSVHEWYHTRGVFAPISTGASPDILRQSWSGGAFHLVGGLGLRARIFGQSFQFEARRYNYTTAFTVGGITF